MMNHYSQLGSHMNRRDFLKMASTITALFAMIKSTKARPAKLAKAWTAKQKNAKKNDDYHRNVISIHCAEATDWDFKAEPYVDYSHSDVIKQMLNLGVQELVGGDTQEISWQKLFSNYTPGDRIAIKINVNDIHKELHGFYTSPIVVGSIISCLKDNLDIPEQNIMVYDCARGIPAPYRQRVGYQVDFVEGSPTTLWRKIKKHITKNLAIPDPGKEITMHVPVHDEHGNAVNCYLPVCLSDVKHIINVPIFKSHQFVLASGALKNHYGTVRFSDGINYPKYLHPPIIHQAIADLNAHPDVMSKTRLVIMDALFGRLSKKSGKPQSWQIFGNQTPNRLFISCDPVALDTVSSGYVREELIRRKKTVLSDQYLELAEKAGIGRKSEITLKEITI